jgi:hypothetical protein
VVGRHFFGGVQDELGHGEGLRLGKTKRLNAVDRLYGNAV